MNIPTYRSVNFSRIIYNIEKYYIKYFFNYQYFNRLFGSRMVAVFNF